MSHCQSEKPHENVFPVVNFFTSVAALPVALVKSKTLFFYVKHISRCVYIPKVLKSVISFISVDVVNHFRLFAVSKKPSKPVGIPSFFKKADLHISFTTDHTCNITSNSVTPINLPRKDASIFVVVKDFSDGIWNNLCSHFKSPLDLVRGVAGATAIAPIILLGACTSQEEKREYRSAQVTMVQTQVTAKTQQEVADATARQALYEAMARVAQINPDSADAIAVALAVSSVREEDGDTQPIVQLQREENEALAVVKAVAPALITTLGTVGVAALQADVNKTQSNNAAAVAIADAATDADIMRSVTDMATSGLENSWCRCWG